MNPSCNLLTGHSGHSFSLCLYFFIQNLMTLKKKTHNKTNSQIFSFLMCVLCCCFSHVQLFPTPWTVTCQAPLSMGILQARILEWVPNTRVDGLFNTSATWEGPRILEWVSMPSSRESSWPRDWTSISCLLNCQLGSLPLAQPGKPFSFLDKRQSFPK